MSASERGEAGTWRPWGPRTDDSELDEELIDRLIQVFCAPKLGPDKVQGQLVAKLTQDCFWPPARAREKAKAIIAEVNSWPQEKRDQRVQAYNEERARAAEERIEQEISLAQMQIYVRREAQRRLDDEDREPLILEMAADVRKEQPPPDLVEGMIPCLSIGPIFGQSGTYKSFLALHLQLCVGSGQDFLGCRVLQPGCAVYIMGEGVNDRGRRLDAALDHNPAFTDAHLGYIKQTFPLSSEAAVDEAIEKCQAMEQATGEPVRLVVFDSLADFYGAGDNENSASDMSRLIGGMKRIRDVIGCTVLANAHTGLPNKDGDVPERQRGSSRFRNAWDFEIMATGEALECMKPRYGPFFDPVPYQMAEHGGTLVVERGALAASGQPEEHYWPYPVSGAKLDRVVQAVRDTPGQSMSTLARAIGMHKEDVRLALIRASEVPLVVNSGTETRPKWMPGPVYTEFLPWLHSQELPKDDEGCA